MYLARAASIENFADKLLNQIINPVIWIVSGLAVLVFIWGVVEFIAKADNEEARKTGKQHILWGLIGLAIIFGIKGVIQILTSIFE